MIKEFGEWVWCQCCRFVNWWTEGKLLALFTGILTLFTYFLWQTSQHQSDYIELADRPWISVNKVDFLQMMEHGKEMIVSISVINGGRSPALEVVPSLRLELRYGSEVSVNKSLQSECNKPKREWKDRILGQIVLPRIDNNIKWTVNGPKLIDSDVDAIRETGSIPLKSGEVPTQEFANLPRHGLYLTGCVDYFDQFHRPYRTL